MNLHLQNLLGGIIIIFFFYYLTQQALFQLKTICEIETKKKNEHTGEGRVP